MKSNYSDLILEKFVLQELDHKTAGEIEEASLEDNNLMERIKTLKKSNEAFTESFNTRQEAYKIKLKVNERKHSFQGLIDRYITLPKVSYLSSAVALCFMFLVASPFLTQEVQNEGIRLKGLAPHLIVYKKTADQVKQLRNGDNVHSGELLQLSYVAAGEKFGAVFSIDGNGLLTLHHPARPNKMAKLVSGKQVILPNAYELDSSPNFETFYLITSDTAVEISTIIESLKAQAKTKARVIKFENSEIKTQYTLSLTKVQDL